MKKLKYWYSFENISESKLEFINGFSPLSEDKLRDYLVDFEDNGYTIDFVGGYAYKIKEPRYVRWQRVRVENKIFDNKLKPSVLITLSAPDYTNDEELTDSLTSFFGRVSNYFPEYQIQSQTSELLDLDDVECKNGFIAENGRKFNNLKIILIYKDFIEFTSREIFYANNWVRRYVLLSEKNDDVHLAFSGRFLGLNLLIEENSDKYVPALCTEKPEYGYWIHKIQSDQNVAYIQARSNRAKYLEHEQVLEDLNLLNLKLLIKHTFKSDEDLKYSPFSKSYRTINELLAATKKEILKHNIGNFFIRNRGVQNEKYEDIVKLNLKFYDQRRRLLIHETIIEEFRIYLEKLLETEVEIINPEPKIKASILGLEGSENNDYGILYSIKFNVKWLQDLTNHIVTKELWNDPIYSYMIIWANKQKKPNFRLSNKWSYQSSVGEVDIDKKEFNLQVREILMSDNQRFR